MYRRFNYTKRREIARQHCQIDLHRMDGDRAYFSARLQLGDYEFDQSASIRIDAWRSNASQRWDFGTTGEPVSPAQSERVLRDVPSTALFKVSVVASDGSGRLLGVSPALKPKRVDEPRESLLPIVAEDLGSEVWRLDFGSGADTAELQINSRIEGGVEAVAGSPSFRPIALPAVFREVLTHAILVSGEDSDDTSEGVWDDWLKLASHHLGGERPPYVPLEADDELWQEAAHWIDRAVKEFAAKHEFMSPESFADVLAGRS